MKLFAIFSCFFLCFLHAAPSFAWESYRGRTFTAYVRGLEPGNTVLVNRDNRDNENTISIRLYGVGIPTQNQPYGQQAHQKLLSLLPIGQKLIITTVNEDGNGNYSALVQLNDHSLNNMLVDEGLAWVDRSTCKAFFCRRWHIQENLSIKDRRGIWSLNIPTPPWQWGEIAN